MAAPKSTRYEEKHRYGEIRGQPNIQLFAG